MSLRKIAVIGGSIWGNRGAAMMLETTIGKLKESFPDAEFYIYTPYPIEDSILNHDTQLRFFDSRPMALVRYFLIALWERLLGYLGKGRQFPDSVYALTHSDILLDIGGITFSDGRLIFLPYNILTIFPSLMFNVPVVKLSQAAGSFTNPVIRVLSRLFLMRCEHFFARGERTFEFVTELGLDTNRVTLASDIAFSYEPEYNIAVENKTAVSQLCVQIDSDIASGHKIIAISPSVVVWDKMKAIHLDYIKLLTDLIRRIDERDVTFVVFPNASREGSKKKRNNDIRVIENLRDNCEIQLPYSLYKRVRWFNFDMDTRGIEDVINRADVLLASRFHAMIFGLRLGIPTIVIGWGHKYKEVMSRMGQDTYVLNYTASVDDVLDVLKDALKNKRVISSNIQMALIGEKKSSLKQFDYLTRNIL